MRTSYRISDRARIAACLVVCALLAYAAVLFAGATFVGRDHLTHTIPAKQFIADALSDGRLPQWWPAVDLGVPFVANPDHSALYPPVWLVAALPMPFAADLVLVLHVLLAGLGTSALARRLGADTQGAIVGGAAFMLGGFVTSAVVTGGPLLTIAWAPWIAWAADRVAASTAWRPRLCAALGLAAFGGAQLLAGHPSMVIAGGLLAVGIGLCRARDRLRTLAALAIAYLGALALAAVLLVPALLLASESSRAGGLAGEAATWSMHPSRILEWIWPGLLGDPNQPSEHLARVIADTGGGRVGPAWALSLYVSLPIVALAVLACVRDRALRWLAIVVALFVLLALGRYTPFYDIYRTVFLPERLVRYPEKYLGGAVLLACALAGVGWTSLANRLPGRRGTLVIGAAVALFGALLLAFPLLVPGSHELVDIDAALAYARRNGGFAIVVVLAVFAACAATKRPRMRWLGVAVLAGHFIVLAWQTLPVFDRDILARPPQIVHGIATSAHPRLARPFEHAVRPADHITAQARTLYEGAAPNAATRFGFTYLVGYDQAHSAQFRAWRPTLATATDQVNDLFAADYAIVWADRAEGPVLAADAPFGPYALVGNEGARPRAFVAPRWRPTTDDTATRDVLANLDLATVHLVGAAPASEPNHHALAPCTITAPRPEAVDVTCDAAFAGYAVLLDAWSPGWSATVDGKPARIERAEGLVRAVRVDAGRHTIAYRYATPGLGTGAIISLVAWVLLIAAYFGMRSE